MNQKLIALDLDGTTLNGDGHFAPETIDTLHQLVELGHKIAIVTGRPYRSSQDIYDELGLGGPIVNFNGALLHIPSQPDWDGQYNITLDEDIVYDLMDYYKEIGCDYFIVEGKDSLYATVKKIPDSPYYPKDQDPIFLTPGITLEQAPTAITVFSSVEAQPAIKEKLLARYGSVIDVRTWGGDMPCLEIVTHGIHKGTGIEHLSRFFQIPHEDILAFGDEDNDIEMIQSAGHGVAMQNAIPELKAVADDVTPYPNTENGLARYLQDYFNL